jgi:glycosyltransferase involved in cell wall biosynthesis
MIKTKLKSIVLWGVHPFQPSGLGKICKLMLNSLEKIGYKVYVVSYDGQNLAITQNIRPYHPQLFDDILNFVKSIEPEYIISIGDLWRMEPVYRIVKTTCIKWIAYVGCEGINYPNSAWINRKEKIDLQVLIQMISAIWAYDKRSSEIFSKKFNIRTEVLPHAVNIDGIKNSNVFPIKETLGIENDKKLALLIADNIQRKGLDLFCEFISRYTDWVGYLHSPIMGFEIGFDIEEMKVAFNIEERIYTKNDLKNKLGRDILTESEIFGLYKACDLYLHPHRAEGFGLTVLEALVAGAPVLSTDCCGPREFLPDDYKIPVRNQKYVQLGGVGYLINEPEMSFTIPDKKKRHHQNFVGYSIREFRLNLIKLLSLKYPTKYWLEVS